MRKSKVTTVTIAAVLAIGTFYWMTFAYDSREMKAKANLRMLDLGVYLHQFKEACGRYPTTVEGIELIRSAPNWCANAKYYSPPTGRKLNFTDGSGVAYVYDSDGLHFKLSSTEYNHMSVDDSQDLRSLSDR